MKKPAGNRGRKKVTTKKKTVPKRTTERKVSSDSTDAIFKERQILRRGYYIVRKTRHEYANKTKIAAHVVEEYIADFDSVLLDAGSTLEFIATEVFLNKQYISIMTNNMGAYASYSSATPGKRSFQDGSTERPHEKNAPTKSFSNNELILSGGRYDVTYESLQGGQTIKAFMDFSPNVIIIGVSGIKVEEGLFCHGGEEKQVKALLCDKPTDKRIIATDWTKIGRRDAHKFGDVVKLDAYTTDSVILVTNKPGDVSSKIAKRFYDEIDGFRKLGITVDLV